MKIRLLYCTIVFVVLFGGALANNDRDSVEKKYAITYQFLNNLQEIRIDTTLDQFDSQFNVLRNNRASIGNIGSPTNSFVPEFKISPSGFILGANNFDYYSINNQNIRFYTVRKPFTEIGFISGAKQDQRLNINHQQRLGKKFYAGFRFNKIASEGFYLQQKTNITGVSLNLKYETNNNRYGIISNYIFNDMKIEENGGILNDSLFSNIEFGVGKDGIPIRLNNANNLVKGKSVYVKQHLNFGKKIIHDDSLKSVSIEPKLRLNHSFNYTQTLYNYIDEEPDSLFYSDLFKKNSADNYVVFDSINHQKIENEISLRPILSFNSFSFIGEILYRHESNKVVQNFDDTTFCVVNQTLSNHIIGGRIDIGNIKKTIHSSFSADYTLRGYNDGDYYVKNETAINIKNNLFFLKLGIKQRHPDFIHSKFCSNQFDWHNDFKSVRTQKVEIEYQNQKLGTATSVTYGSEMNSIFWNYSARPSQFLNSSNVIQVNFRQKFKVKNFRLRVNSIYQIVQKGNLYNIPKLLLYGALYYEDFFFKESTFSQVGFDIYYQSVYYGDYYMPLTRQFYLQNEKQIGDYPYLDFFIKFKVDKARFFFKIAHLNSGLMGNKYYTVPGYPMRDRSFQIGVNWRFLD